MATRYNKPIPFGWFAVAYCDELAVGDVKPLHYFDQDLVLFRTASGAASVMDAFCPHLGAHLGHGGKVHGDNIGKRLLQHVLCFPPIARFPYHVNVIGTLENVFENVTNEGRIVDNEDANAHGFRNFDTRDHKPSGVNAVFIR